MLPTIVEILKPFGGKKERCFWSLEDEYTGDAAQLGMILGKYERYLSRRLTRQFQALLNLP
jgi:hypothetical protein